MRAYSLKFVFCYGCLSIFLAHTRVVVYAVIEVPVIYEMCWCVFSMEHFWAALYNSEKFSNKLFANHTERWRYTCIWTECVLHVGSLRSRLDEWYMKWTKEISNPSQLQWSYYERYYFNCSVFDLLCSDPFSRQYQL